MPLVTKESIIKAREMDLLTYLKNYEPEELVRESRNVYTTRTHDSLKISNGKWCWWSRNIGGRSALDYLVFVRGMKLPEAVLHLEGQTAIKPPKAYIPEYKKDDSLILPPRNNNHYFVRSYLRKRCIHPRLIDYLIRNNLLYESRKYHNAVFVGYDKNKQPRYAVMRGTTGKKFYMEARGSDKRFSFSLPANRITDQLHVFESAIDLISFASIELFEGRDPLKDSMLSLGGVFAHKNADGKLPLALEQYLKDHQETKTIRLHLDNDAAGRGCSEYIISSMSSKYTVLDEPPPSGKDYNDYLCSLNIFPRRKEVCER